jgi:hypothetical protein
MNVFEIIDDGKRFFGSEAEGFKDASLDSAVEVPAVEETVLRADGVRITRSQVGREGLHYCDYADCYCDKSYDEFACNCWGLSR